MAEDANNVGSLFQRMLKGAERLFPTILDSLTRAGTARDFAFKAEIFASNLMVLCASDRS